MTAPINNSFYADPKGLNALRSDAKAQAPDALKETARQFESLFTNMLLKSMREATKSTGGDSMFDSEQTEFYQGMFDDQMAVHLSQGRGLGLADMLVRQLSQSRMTQSADVSGTNAADSGKKLNFDADKLTVRSAATISSTAAPASPTSIASSRVDFVRTMWPLAQKAASALGVDPHALLAQAALETGWGKSVPADNTGDSSYNLFGIKAGGQWAGATTNVPTLEFESGVAVRKVDRFRAYDSAEQSFNDYAGLIGNNPRYEKAVGTGTDVAAFAAALQEGGYATDPQYAQKIVAVADQVRSITRSVSAAAAAPARGSHEV
jgi:flagellar protein FlgJ